jgi:2,6-dihydroxypyridine 3-monooxygenase
MTGRDGIRRPVTLPPGSATDEAVAGMRQAAGRLLAAPIAEVVTSVPEPFVQAIYDIEVPRMVSGRVCLIGDAAFAVRPHAAAGTAKAAQDGWALAEELTARDGNVPAALAAWERRQLALGRSLLARTRVTRGSSSACTRPAADPWRPGGSPSPSRPGTSAPRPRLPARPDDPRACPVPPPSC